LVNRKLNSFSGAGIYAIRQGDVILLRRVFVGIDGSYTFKNDNEAYPPEKVTAPMLESMKMEVLGRVVWKGKKL
jgi:phage repressor protein C with HTH and peptisase S24 domain